MRDQTAKRDGGKLRLTLVPTQIIYDIAAVREYGVGKYKDPDNWRRVEVERYRDAAYRHFLAYIDDPFGLDEESGLPHRWHLECNLAFLAELETPMMRDLLDENSDNCTSGNTGGDISPADLRCLHARGKLQGGTA